MQRIEFQGRTAQEAKRRALSYWYQHHQSLGMSLAQFFAQCRGSQAAAGAMITFYPAAAPPAADHRTAA
jgi:hypothetical protein